MKIYELLIGFSTSIEGKIWCTDGSFIEPSMYQSSGKKAYGYALNDTTVVRLTRSSGMEWSSKNNYWHNTNFIRAQSLTDGVVNSNYLRSLVGGFNPINCPAVYYACTQFNGGKTSYMPSVGELLTLYESIMYGNMKSDLETAGLYERCNYRTAGYRKVDVADSWWGYVWSSSQDSSNADYALEVYYDGKQSNDPKSYEHNCVIPFFKVQ